MPIIILFKTGFIHDIKKSYTIKEKNMKNMFVFYLVLIGIPIGLLLLSGLLVWLGRLM